MIEAVIFDEAPEIDYMCEKFIVLNFQEHSGDILTEDILKLFEICLKQNKTIILNNASICREVNNEKSK